MADSLTAPKILQAPTRVGTGTLAANVKVLALRVGVAAGTEVEVDAQATYQLISVPAGVMVLAVLARIITAFTTSLTMTIGDGDSTAGFLASADIGPTTADTAGIYKNSILAGEAYAHGKKYLAADTIDAVIAGATPAAGLMELLLVYLDATEGTT